MDGNTLAADAATDVLSSGGRGSLALMALIGGLYFTQGLPMGLVMEALPVVLRQNGVPLDVLALVPMAGLPWIVKIFWAPLIDNHWIGRLGRRRTWILAMQALLCASFVTVAFVAPTDENVVLLIAVTGIGMIASATQDTATDGLAAERLRASALGYANTLQIGGLMAGFMVGGGGTLLLIDSLGLRTLMLLLALIPFAGFLGAALWRENGSVTRPAPADRASVLKSFKRVGILPMLLLTFLYGGAHAGGISVTKLFLVDLGWSNTDTGLVTAYGGLVLILIGSPLGGRLAGRGLWSGLSIGVAVVMAAFGMWALLALQWIPAQWPAVALAALLLNVGSGIIAVTSATLVMAFGGAGRQAGTDVTLLQSVNVAGEMLIAGLVVWLASQTGYGPLFVIVSLGCLLIILAGRFARRRLPETVLNHLVAGEKHA